VTSDFVTHTVHLVILMFL